MIKPSGRIAVLLVPAILTMTALRLDGQKKELDAVYLNNGEVYRGFLAGNPDTGLVELETLSFNTRIFKREEISRIEREKLDRRGVWGLQRSARGYFNRTDIGALIGSGNNSKNTILSIQMVNGYTFGRKYCPGVGVGLEFYEQAYLPLFADFLYRITGNGVSPFLRASFGYALPMEDPPEQWGARTDNRGGYMFGIGLGTAVHAGSSGSMVISLVYRFQSLKSIYTEDWNNDVLHLEKEYNRIALRLGFVFD